MLTGPRRTLLIFSLAHAFIFCLFFIPAQTAYYDPGALERFLAMKILDGQVPYRDFPCEYPPLALVAFLLPALVAQTQVAYNVGFYLEMFVFDVLIMWVMMGVAARLGISAGKALGIYTVLLLAIGPLVIIRFDLLPALLVMVSLKAFLEGRNKSAWAALAFGAMVKLFPVFIAPVYALYQFINRRYRALFSGGITFLACVALVIVPLVMLRATGIWASLGYHIGRGLHSESTLGTLLLTGQMLGLTRVEGGLSSGSWNLISPLADTLAGLSFYISAGFMLVIFGWLAGMLRRQASAPVISTGLRLLQFAFLVILVFIVTNKVLSAQYLIWLCPLLALMVRRGEESLWILFVAAALLTQWIFPYGYYDFEQFKPYAIIMMLARNLLLIAVAVLTVKSICRIQGGKT